MLRKKWFHFHSRNLPWCCDICSNAICTFYLNSLRLLLLFPGLSVISESKMLVMSRCDYFFFFFGLSANRLNIYFLFFIWELVLLALWSEWLSAISHPDCFKLSLNSFHNKTFYRQVVGHASWWVRLRPSPHQLTDTIIVNHLFFQSEWLCHWEGLCNRNCITAK